MAAAAVVQRKDVSLPSPVVQGDSDREEDIGHYKFGSGEVLASRYELVRQLGEGTFGRVVLARDTLEDRRVAVKVIRNVDRYAENGEFEAAILRDIRSSDTWGVSRCVCLLDSFTHGDGFYCLVLEHLGICLLSLLRRNSYRGFWMQDIQGFAAQLLKALRFLHQELRLIHTDLKLENVLLQSAETPKCSRFLREPLQSKEEGGLQAPDPREYLRPVSNQIKLIDFGSATYECERRPKKITTRHYRAPEVVLELGWTERCDLWSLGCMLVELYTGELLFQVRDNLEHLMLMEHVLGKLLPKHMLAAAGSSVRDDCILEHAPGQWQLHRSCHPAHASSTPAVFGKPRIRELIHVYHAALADLAASLLALDPDSRPSAAEALRHPLFFAEFDD